MFPNGQTKKSNFSAASKKIMSPGRISYISYIYVSMISKYFPGRSMKTIRNVWSKKRDAFFEVFTPEKVRLNHHALR
jgi:hypothetical protein